MVPDTAFVLHTEALGYCDGADVVRPDRGRNPVQAELVEAEVHDREGSVGAVTITPVIGCNRVPELGGLDAVETQPGEPYELVGLWERDS